MSDGREEREERIQRIEQQKKESPQDFPDPEYVIDWEPERVDS